jgi:hypothetical protein
MKTWTLFVLALSTTTAFADTKKPPGKSDGYSGLGAESVSAQEIAKYAAAPLPETVTRKIQAMLVRGAGTGILTSKGDRMVFSTRITGIAQIWQQDDEVRDPADRWRGSHLATRADARR